MNCSFFKSFTIYFFIIFIFCTVFIPVYSAHPEMFTNTNDFIQFDPLEEYVWPIPEYTTITSPFGKRISPTARCI